MKRTIQTTTAYSVENCLTSLSYNLGGLRILRNIRAKIITIT